MSAADERSQELTPSPPLLATAPPIASVHEALVTQLIRPHTEYLDSFRASQEITLSDLQHVQHAISATSAKMDQAEATFAKLPHYIAKLATMQRNLIILHDNAQKTNALAKGIAAQLGVADVAAARPAQK